MRPGIRPALLCLALALGPLSQAQPNPVVITVDAAHPGAAMSPQMFGIFFEDINFAADGGLYPELVKNRSFEFDEAADRVARDHGRECERTRRARRANSTFALKTR